MNSNRENIKLFWITDPHINFIYPLKLESFISKLGKEKPDLVVITGDISEAPNLSEHLTVFSKIDCPTYFILGNHDFYGGSIQGVRKDMKKLHSSAWPKNDISPIAESIWLGNTDYVALNKEWALVGHDGWYDARHGDVQGTTVELNDFYHIKEIVQLIGDRLKRKEKFQQLARKSANFIKKGILKAKEDGYNNFIVATHVPPFRQNSIYMGKISDDDFLPFFTSKVLGDTLLKLSDEFPKSQFVTLCGHSHGEAVYSPKNNLKCFTGKANYRKIFVAGVLDLNHEKYEMKKSPF